MNDFFFWRFICSYHKQVTAEYDIQEVVAPPTRCVSNTVVVHEHVNEQKSTQTARSALLQKGQSASQKTRYDLLYTNCWNKDGGCISTASQISQTGPLASPSNDHVPVCELQMKEKWRPIC